MKILFSSSESKIEGGKYPPLSLNSFMQKECYKKRLKVIKKYNDIIMHDELVKVCKIFGIKNIKECQRYRKDIFIQKCIKAIKRYSGVAYQYLDYQNLKKDEQEYIDNNTLIFSNLFGAIFAKDKIPFYKLKQGEKLEGFNIENFYKNECSKSLDLLLQDEDILDLRAAFYEKFYKINKRYTKLKFVKNKKVVSHWAKAYRGIVLKEIAKAKITNIDEFMRLSIDGLKVLEIEKNSNFDLIVLEIS